MDLTRWWFAEKHRKIKSYIFDYHRPIHHANVNSEKKVYLCETISYLQIIMIDDGYYNIEEVPADEDFDIQLDDDLDDLSVGGEDEEERDVNLEEEEAEYDNEGEAQGQGEPKITEIQTTKDIPYVEENAIQDEDEELVRIGNSD